MSGDLIIRKLKDVIFEVIDNRGKNPESYSKYGIPVIDNFLINGNKSIDLNEVKRYITEDVYNGFLRKTLNAGDVLITLVGNGYGQVATSPEEKSCIIQNTIGLRTNDDNDNGFLFYLLKLNRKSIMDLNRGAAQPSVKAGDLLDLEFKFLSKANQIKVAKILGDLDDKITLNRQINQTLEAMAQALFKSWFVDFEPVKAKMSVIADGGSADDANLAAMSAISGKTTEQLLALKTTNPDQYQQLVTTADLFPSEMVDSELGEIPKGWEVKSLDQIAHYQNGLALQKFRPENENDFLPVVKIAELKKGYADGEEKASPNIKPECIIDNGDVVFSWSGSLMVDIWCGGKAALNQHLFKVTSLSYPKWFFYQFTLHHLENFQRIAQAKAVTMGHIKREHLEQALCAVPSNHFIETVNQYFEPTLNKAIECRLENNTLTTLRDSLLPKLLSGKLL